VAHRVDSLRCEGSDAIGAKRTCRERRERVDLTKMTRSGPRCDCLIALQQTAVRLFNHLIGDGEDARRNRETKCLRGLEVEDQREFCWLLNREIDRIGALENAVEI
jgi:hypothetical protein